MSGSPSQPQGAASEGQQQQQQHHQQQQQQQNQVGATAAPRTEQELAQAFRELARGEQTAAALEANLTSLESKLDELLASMEAPTGNATTSVPNGKGGKEGEAQAGHKEDA